MEKAASFTIKSNKKHRTAAELLAHIIFTICAFFAILAVISITVYMLINGLPAFFKVGVKEILFSSVWAPAAAEPKYGILNVILTSVVGTGLAVLIGVPIGLFTAIFLAEIAPKKVAAVIQSAVELLAGIPSVVYGLLGIYLLCPVMYKLELAILREAPHTSLPEEQTCLRRYLSLQL